MRDVTTIDPEVHFGMQLHPDDTQLVHNQLQLHGRIVLSVGLACPQAALVSA